MQSSHSQASFYLSPPLPSKDFMASVLSERGRPANLDRPLQPWQLRNLNKAVRGLKLDITHRPGAGRKRWGGACMFVCLARLYVCTCVCVCEGGDYNSCRVNRHTHTHTHPLWPWHSPAVSWPHKEMTAGLSQESMGGWTRRGLPACMLHLRLCAWCCVTGEAAYPPLPPYRYTAREFAETGADRTMFTPQVSPAHRWTDYLLLLQGFPHRYRCPAKLPLVGAKR